MNSIYKLRLTVPKNQNQPIGAMGDVLRLMGLPVRKWNVDPEGDNHVFTCTTEISSDQEEEILAAINALIHVSAPLKSGLVFERAEPSPAPPVVAVSSVPVLSRKRKKGRNRQRWRLGFVP